MHRPKHFFWRLVAHIRFFLRKSKKHNIPALSGRSAFFLILSIIPFLMFIHTLSVMLGNVPVYHSPTEVLQNNVEPIVYDLLMYVYQATQKSASGVVVITAVVALWSAGNGVYTITEGVTRVYRLKDHRLWLVKRIYAMGHTVVVLLLLLLGFIVMILNIYLTGVVRTFFDNIFVTILVNSLQYFLVKFVEIIFLTVSLKLFLRRRITDKRYRSFRALLPGMFLTTIAWELLSWGLKIYVEYFAQSSVYGSLGTVVIVMMWVYFMIYAFLWGVQFNCLYRLRLHDLRIKPSRLRAKKKRRNHPPEGSDQSNQFS